MDIFYTFCFIIIMINQFVIQVKLLDIEDEIRFYKRLRRNLREGGSNGKYFSKR